MTVTARDAASVATPVLARPGWKARMAGSPTRRLPGRLARSVVASFSARVGSAHRLTASRQAWSEPPAYQASTNRAVTSSAAAWSASGTYDEPPCTVVVNGMPMTTGGLIGAERLLLGSGEGVYP